jgi:nitrite reductase (NO-forming)
MKRFRTPLLFALPFILSALFTAAVVAVSQSPQPPADYNADVAFTLETNIAEGKLVFIGVGGDIDGVVNPDLHVPEAAVVQVTLVNGDGMEHDIAFPDFDAQSDFISRRQVRNLRL